MNLGGRPLNQSELDSYDVLVPELAARVRVYNIAWQPGPYKGITIGRRIFLSTSVSEDGTSALLAHELVHVRQWAELGLIGFLWNYLGDFSRNLIRSKRWNHAYHQIRAEQEARSEAGRWNQRRLSEGPSGVSQK